LNLKIREAQLQKLPYMLVVGNKEAEAGTAAVRLRDGRDLGSLNLAALEELIAQDVESRSLTPAPGR
jgi:threonyl-tRNA synthetase